MNIRFLVFASIFLAAVALQIGDRKIIEKIREKGTQRQLLLLLDVAVLTMVQIFYARTNDPKRGFRKNI